VNIGFLGSVFGTLNLMIWISFLLLIVAHITLFRTPIGLRLRSVGEHPRAADTVGISVYGDPLRGRDPVRDARGSRRRLPVDRLRRLFQTRT
jgi:hypothetical protein